MRLTSLKIKGFKSFANDTVINFSEDVIGIIGPNGSGKSNIVDSIRWVLGEQKSKDLRLDKMASVIFNGTKKRKSSGMASVSLTLENTKNILPTEYQTVTITRILYSSGDSEYRLNDVKCRLKDINSLFLDSGIGSNSYAIISLSMVDDLLMDNNNSRQMMFEQAAGISKYKTRKHQTLNKLKNTEEDLSRIDDLLFEIEGNMKTLERQAKRTQRFYDIKEAYKTNSIHLAIMRASKSKEVFKDLEQKIQQESDSLIKVEAQEKMLEAKLAKLRKEQVEKEADLSEIQRDANEFLSGIRKMENEKQMAEQRLSFIRENHSRHERQIANAENRITVLQEDIARDSKALEEQLAIEKQLQEELAVIDSELKKVQQSHQALQVGMDEFVERQQELEKNLYELEKKKAINLNQIEVLRKDLDQNSSDIEAKTDEGKNLQKELRLINEQIAKAEKIVQTLSKNEEKRQALLDKLQQQQEETKNELVKEQREFDAVQNEYKLTKSMVENLEGFPASIKFLKKSNTSISNIPLLTDIIFCEAAYRVAIENYLKPYLNHYLVPTYEDAQQAITLLQRSQKGKASFFILDELQPQKGSIQKIKGAVPADSLLEIELQYQPLVQKLLYKTYIVEDHETALELRKKHPECTFIEKSGSFISKGNNISGGSVGLFEGKKIGRRKNLEALEKKMGRLDKKIKSLLEKLEKIQKEIKRQNDEDNRQEINIQNKQINHLSHQRITFATRLENIESFVSSFGQKAGESKDYIEHLTQVNKEIEGELEIAQEEYRQFKNELQSADEGFREVANALATTSERYNQKNIAYIQQQNRVAALERELAFRKNQYKETSEHLMQTSKTLSQTDTEVATILETITSLQNRLAEDYAVKKEKESYLNEAEQIWHRSRGEINELEEEVRDNFKKRQETMSLVTTLKEKFNELKLDMASITERIEIEFGVSRDELFNMEVPEGLDFDKIEAEAKKQKERLNRFGEINPLAIEAFNEIKGRHDTIFEQRQDILEAKDSLLATIQEIDETATAQFMDAFEKVRSHFKEVFRSLFTEDDDCDLKLEFPDRPLESKIKITAKPKGKRPQSISLLSGGEKTLTATALLFALYLLKPAPFCIFDEVDAPLDDANIDKFNRIIKKFSKDSQFIIITHNKQTMAAVDIIYGVYMQEPGVSGVTPVDFRTYSHEAMLVDAKS